MEGIPKALNRGRYTVTDPLGTGGMATVLLCYDHGLQAWRAVKFLLPSLAGKSSARQRFDLEARSMASIEHPHILRVYDVGEAEGLPFMVMEYAPGGSLENFLEIHKKMTPALASSALQQICRGVQAAHDAGIIHRDLKPENVLVNARGNCKVTDFGIAQVVKSKSYTRTGSVMGTLAYMAPEQRRDAKHVGPTADVYALGATLFTLVTGTVPADLFVSDRDPTMLDAVPDALRPIVAKCVSMAPEARYQTATALGAALKRVQGTLDGVVDAQALVTRTIVSTEPPEPTMPASTDPTYFPPEKKTPEAAPKVLPYFMPDQRQPTPHEAPEYLDDEPTAADREARKAKALRELTKLKKRTPGTTGTPAAGRMSERGTPAPAGDEGSGKGAAAAANVAESIQDGAVWALITTLKFLLRPLLPMAIPFGGLFLIGCFALAVGSWRVGNARSAAASQEAALYAVIEAEARVIEDLDAYNAPEELAASQLQMIRKLKVGPEKRKTAGRYIDAVNEAIERYAPGAPPSQRHRVDMSYTRMARLKGAQRAHVQAMLEWEQAADTSLGRMACSLNTATCP